MITSVSVNLRACTITIQLQTEHWLNCETCVRHTEHKVLKTPHIDMNIEYTLFQIQFFPLNFWNNKFKKEEFSIKSQN